MHSLRDDILALVEIPSVTGNESTLAEWLTARLARSPHAVAHEITRIGDSLVVRPRERGTLGHAVRPLVVLAGHTDTVPVGEAPSPRLVEGKVHGRGSADMKAGLAVMLGLYESMRPDSGFASLAYVFYAGEEGAAEKNELRVVMEEAPWLASADLAILLEPTAGSLELGCQGSLHLEVEFQGKACHSARPWLGEHPLRKALPWLERTLAIAPREVTLHGVSFKEVVSLTQLHAGEARNVIPGVMRVNVNLRYPPDRSPEEAEAYAFRLAPPAEHASVAIRDHAVAAPISMDAPLYRHLLARTGLPRSAKQAWTDVARFTALGVPALNWGPGDPRLAHTKEEWVDAAEADRVLAAMRDFFLGPAPEPEGVPE
ncbi:MAG: succinyl-diaminopimelate desuccinylase [Candidatus Eisenbacteria bacterium]